MLINPAEPTYMDEHRAKALADKLTLGEAEQEAAWTYTTVRAERYTGTRYAWTVDVYDEDGIRLGAL